MKQTPNTTRGKERAAKRRVDRRRHIVTVTVQLLAKYGVQGTTVSRISAAARISRSALYYYFSNREALLEAALEELDRTATAWISEPPCGDVPSRLLAIADAHSAWALSADATFIRPFYQLITSERETRLTLSISIKHEIYLQSLVERVEEGKREGTISADVDPREVAWSLYLHAWGEDIARFMGLDEYINEGLSRNIFRRLLSTFTPPASCVDATGLCSNGVHRNTHGTQCVE